MFSNQIFNILFDFLLRQTAGFNTEFLKEKKIMKRIITILCFKTEKEEEKNG